MISDKIRAHHLERKAILYIRQSSAHQVLHNRESSALQYAMRDRLTALGWSEIEVIDDDLGRYAAGGVQRTGFERMVAQVCLGKVGAVAAREVSRFARNSRDWQQLIEMCRVVDTVLIDQETIMRRVMATIGFSSVSKEVSTSTNSIYCDNVSLPPVMRRLAEANSWSVPRWATSRRGIAMRRIPIAACRKLSSSSSTKFRSSAARDRLCSGSSSTISSCR